MVRPQRLFLPAHPHHVIQRGHNHGPIFLDDEDRRQYLHHLAEVARESRVAVHAYALGEDRVHLLLTPQTAEAISRMMQALGRRYVAAFNRRHGRSGTLWTGRFASHLVDEASVLGRVVFVRAGGSLAAFEVSGQPRAVGQAVLDLISLLVAEVRR